MRHILSCMMLAAGALIGASANAAAPASTVNMTREAFAPEMLDVTVGTTITWINNDDMPHSVTANDGQFDSGPIQPGKRYQWTAKGAGTIAYHCIFHPSMTATVTVSAKP